MSVLSASSHILYKDTWHKEPHQKLRNGLLTETSSSRCGYNWRESVWKRKAVAMRKTRVEASWADLGRASSVTEMESIDDPDHFDRVLATAQELSQPIVIDWMANWCRKCIYLKPKLEKLATEFESKIKFYYVDVNKVPQSLVKRGNISKMPTIQVWKDGEMKAEVIGGHKAWLVVEEVRQMIQKFV